MDKKVFNKWWFWVITLFGIISTMFFFIAMSYSLHPTEIRIYANDEMVATSENMFKISTEQNFNDCVGICKEIDAETLGESSYACWDVCYGFYKSNWTYTSQTNAQIAKESFDRCFDKLLIEKGVKPNSSPK